MRLKGRNLRAGMVGEDVASLHRELVELGYQIPDSEIGDGIFGVGTAGAVAAFQTTRGLLDTAVVDAGTAEALSRAHRRLSEETVISPPAAGSGHGEGQQPEETSGPAAGPPADPDVVLVHRALEAIGVEVADAERDAHLAGPSTREAVARLQSLVGLVPSGEVDPATVTMARAALERLRVAGGTVAGGWLVDGTVHGPDGLPLEGATVVAHRRELRGSTEVGRDTTGHSGRFRVTYQAPDRDRSAPVPPGLQFDVLDTAGTLLHRSPVHHRLPRQAQVLLAVGGPGRAGPVEYAALGRTLGQRLGQLRPEELLENEHHRDISFLADDTGLDRESIAFYSVASRLADTTGLPAELFYALFRQQVPADAAVAVLATTGDGADLDRNAARMLDAVLAASPEARARAVDEAVAAGTIRADYAQRAGADLARLSTLALDTALQHSHGMGKTPMATVLSAAGIPPAQQQRFIARYTAIAGPTRGFWRGLAGSDEFTREEVGALRFATDVGRVTRGHLPLVEILLEMRTQGRIKGTRDLARLTAEDWKAMVRSERNGQTVGIPANLTAQDEEQAEAAYAFLLERRFELMHPTVAFSARLAEDVSSPLPARDAVVGFLDANPTFSLRLTNVDRLLADRPGALSGADRAAVRESLLTCQRLLKLADRYAVARPLLADRIHSAQQIYAMGRTRFLRTYGDHPDVGTAQAARVYGLAEQTYAMSLSVVMNLSAPLVGVDPSAVAPAHPQAPPAEQPPAPPEGGVALPALEEFPNLQTLFGSLDMCACAHCRSVLSPAAYLVDMLQFLGRRQVDGTTTARDVLFARRPDLAHIELTCANTNTVMPYIDLVNELLEDAVAPPADPVAAARARQTTLTTEELNANPEHTNAAAYATLAGAVYPWLLPFDLPLAEARTYLGLLGTDRVALMRTFGEPAGPGSEPAVATATEGLGLSAFEADIITGGPLASGNPPWAYWGLSEDGNTVSDPVEHTVGYTGTWIEVLSHVRVLLDRSGMTYQTLTELLNTVFVNPDGAVTLRCEPVDSCDLGRMTVDGLSQDVLQRMHRFVRLQRRLGWDVYDTDTAVALLQEGAPEGLARLNTTLLRQLFAGQAAMRRLNIPVAAAVALLARIDTREVPPLPGEDRRRYSLYHELFQNRAVLNPVDPMFALDHAGTEIANVGSGPRLADHRATLVAAFEVADADLVLAIEELTDGALTLANLSTLYRAVLLARGLKLTMPELLSLLRLVERETDVAPGHEPIDPFDGQRPELLATFCDEVDRVRRTRFSIPQLDYLLRHDFDAASGVAPDDVAVGTLLKSVRDKLARLAAEQPPGGYHQLGTGLLVQELADALGLPTATVAEVVTSWLPAQADPAQPLVDSWLALPDLPRDPALQDQPVRPDEPGFAGHFADYTALAKLATLLTGFGFTAEESSWLRQHGADAGWLDLVTLPLVPAPAPQGRYARWCRLAGAAGVRATLPSDGTPFTSLLDLALGGTGKAGYLDALQRRTSWPAGSLHILAGDPADATDTGLLKLVYPGDYGSERALARLVPAMAALTRLGVSADISGWLGATVTPAQADAIKQSVKAKYSARRWATVAKTLRDVLREQQRDALVGYLLAHRPADAARWHDAHDVYARYLIDVEMSSCQGTSRIVQANATIQHFVQRCILNLEPGVEVDADADEDWLQWRWMNRYRLWEANRKVFCYPENWIEPALRRDKSPFYRDLENDLLQSEVTREAAADAFRTYLEKLAGVARLDVVGVYHEVRSGSENATTLHVVGRKQGNPPSHYYRQWIDSSRWTAWSKIDLDITSDHVLPVVWNQRLYLFWVVASTKPDRTQQNPSMQMSSQVPGGATTHLEVQLAWSEYKGNKWLPSQTAPQTLVFPGEVEPHQVTLKSSVVEPLLRIDLFTEYGASRTHAAQFVLGGAGDGVEAYVSSSSGLSQVGPQTRGIGTFGPGMGKGAIWPPTSSRYDAMAIVPSTTTYATPARPRIAVCSTTYDLYGSLTSEPVLNKADRFRLLVPHQQLWFDSMLPFFYADSKRAYFVVPTRYYKNGLYFTTTAPASVYNPVYKPRYTFAPHYHPYTSLFLRELNRGGVDRLFRRTLQLDPASVQAGAPTAPFSFGSYYGPTGNVLPPHPTEGVDFERHAGYAIYNWELFFHAPFAIGEALRRNQRFQEAKTWYEYIFDPTSTTGGSVPQRYWVTKPFYRMTAADYWKQRIENLMKLINVGDPEAEEQVAQWRRNPFEPHLIAGLRPVAYQRAVVMRYLDNLIEWGDQLFRQDTLESVNEATQLYVLAADLLGPRPQIVRRPTEVEPRTYAELEPSLDDFSNAVAAAENALPPAQVTAPVDPSIPKLPVLPPLYFGVPPNEQLLGYWDTVADRLFKVRHCMNIEGVVRQLALFAPPIDPGLVVKAAAAGLDLGSVLNDTSTPPPPYRFRIIHRQAVELAQSVRDLGTDLLSCLQLRDADRLELLRSGAEKKLQDEVRAVQQKSVEEADQQIEVLNRNRQVVKERQEYFGRLTEDLMNNWEIAAMALTAGSIVAQGIAIALDSAAGTAHAVVDLQFGASGAGGSPHATVKFGGENVGNAAEGWARVAKVAAAVMQTGAQMATVTAQYHRRQEEWAFQRDLAGRELDLIEAQVVAAGIRQEIATKTRDNHEIVADTAAAVDEFLRTRFTNAELYEWMIAQTSSTYFQAYQLAYTVAKRAEQCFRRELGLRDSSYVQFGYWDSLKKGLRSADRLLYDLRRMEAAYYAQHDRKLELTRHVSLLAVDPYALVALRTSGECVFRLPELLFDLDHPGHYQRTIKTVGLTVPCVVGPYGGVSLTLTLLENQVRDTTDTSPQYVRQPGDDSRFVDGAGGVESIVTSSGQNDSGMFEPRLDDERYLPFEGAGAVSAWRLRLNPVYPQFDHRTISDVVLHLHYTARDGGVALAAEATAAVKSTLNAVALAEGRTGLYRMVSARQEDATGWHRFLHPGGDEDQVLTLDTPADRFAFFTQGMDITVTGVDVLAKLADPGDYTLELARPGAAARTVTMQADPLLGGLHHFSDEALAPPSAIGRAPAAEPYPRWVVRLRRDGAADFRSLDPDEIEDLVLILRYEVTP